MDDRSTDGRSDKHLPAVSPPRLTLVHNVQPAIVPCAAMPAALGQCAGPAMQNRRKGRPGRRLQALLIDSVLPGPDADPVQAIVLARALHRLAYEVTIAPADGELDSELEHLAEDGIVCLGRPAYRSIEEMLRTYADVFDVVCLLGAGVARTYEPLVRLHGPAARVLCCLPGLAYPDLVRQAQYRPELIDTARVVQRQEVMAAYVCDATIVAADVDAEVLRAALPELAVHVVPWSDAAAADIALHRAIGSQARSHRTAP